MIAQTFLVVAPEVLGSGSETSIDSSTNGHRATTPQLEDKSIHTPNHRGRKEHRGCGHDVPFLPSKNLLSEPAEG